MEELKMYIPIIDDNNFIIKHYQYLFNKYWGKHIQVYFLGYTKPEFELDENIHFVSLAPKRNPSPKSWSNELIKYFESIDDEYFYFSLEDYLIIRPVNLELIEVCKEMLTPNIGRVELWNSMQFNPNRSRYTTIYKTHKGVVFNKMNQSAPTGAYRISSSNSIWNRRWFLKTLQNNWSVYDWELIGNGMHHNDGYDVISPLNIYTPSIVHALSSKFWGKKINTDAMSIEDKEKLKEMSEPSDRCTEFFEFKNFNQVINLKGYQPK